MRWRHEEAIILQIQAKIEVLQLRFGNLPFWDWENLPDDVLALFNFPCASAKGPRNSERKKREEKVSRNQIDLIQQLAKIQGCLII